MLAKKAHETERDIETAELKLRAMGPLGDTVADFEGQPINVFGGITGERVVARIYRYRRRKKNIVSAMVDSVLEPSTDRVAPPCPYYGPCSGCQWQHISYPRQLQLKRESVEAQFRDYPRLASVAVSPTRPAPSRFNYRNHARFTVRRGGSIIVVDVDVLNETGGKVAKGLVTYKLSPPKST